ARRSGASPLGRSDPDSRAPPTAPGRLAESSRRAPRCAAAPLDLSTRPPPRVRAAQHQASPPPGLGSCLDTNWWACVAWRGRRAPVRRERGPVARTAIISVDGHVKAPSAAYRDYIEQQHLEAFDDWRGLAAERGGRDAGNI